MEHNLSKQNRIKKIEASKKRMPKHGLGLRRIVQLQGEKAKEIENKEKKQK